MRPVVANLVLWAIAIGAVILFARDSGKYTFLGPALAVCMIGSTALMRRASK